MKRLLVCANYPSYFELGIYNMEKENSFPLFAGKIFLVEIVYMVNCIIKHFISYKIILIFCFDLSMNKS